jgi:hypothetical protein
MLMNNEMKKAMHQTNYQKMADESLTKYQHGWKFSKEIDLMKTKDHFFGEVNCSKCKLDTLFH